MAQGNGTDEGSGGLPSVTPGKVQPSRLDQDQLAVANEFFSSLDTDQIVVPEGLAQVGGEAAIGQQAARVAQQATNTNSPEEEIVAELDVPQEEIWDDTLNEALGSNLQQALPAPTTRAKKRKESSAKKAIPMAKRTRRRRRIEIQEREDEPFQWRDLLTKKGLKKNMGFLISLLLHTFLLLFLSLLVVRTGIGDSTLFLDAALAPSALDDDLLDDFNVNPVIFENEAAEENPDDLLAEVLESESEDVLEEVVANDQPSGGLTQNRAKLGDGKSATFFGTKASGRRFVFVVDRSISMGYGSEDYISRELFNRYDVAKSELLNAIDSLQPHQQFFVVMFAHNTVPMFGQESVEESGDTDFEMIAATRENKTRFQTWLGDVGMGPGTDPRLALEIAIDMRPDAIFFLSDGEFVSERNDQRPKTRDIIQKHIRQRTIVPINTVSLVVEETIETMKGIANRSEGSFKFITILDYIKQVANLRGPMRARALEQLVSSSDSWEDRAEIISNQLLPTLNESSPIELVNTESLLHRATMGLFEDHVDSVFKPNSNAVSRWREIVNEINGFYKTEQVSALGKGRELEQRLLIAMLEQRDSSFIGQFEKLDMGRASNITKIEMVHAIDRSHREFGTSPESIGWLRELIARLSGKKPKARSQLAKVDWNRRQAEAAIIGLLDDRVKRSSEMYRKYRDPRKGSNYRDRIGKALVKKYPETPSAGRVRQDLAQQMANEMPIGISAESEVKVPAAAEDPFAQ